MQWSEILVKYRYKQKSNSQISNERSEFEVDFDRIIFSSAFRKLQDKTQVIPMPEEDFVHTRLTHSLEVSSVGRSLGRKAGNYLTKKYPELENLGISSYDIGSIVAAASLSHDIGNPPFGHSGEAAICEYFLNGKGSNFQNTINDELKWNDLINFEGNANGFRILSNYTGGPDGGLRLCYPTLAAFAKYPRENLSNSIPNRASQKKYGVFQSEREIFKQIADELKLISINNDASINYLRHPLAFLVEAADDICYSIIDFEDGLRLKLIDFAYAEKYLYPILGNLINKDKLSQMHMDEQIAFLRASVINILVEDMSEIFIQNEEAMLQGTFDTSLIKLSKFAPIIEDIKKITREKVYQSRVVLEIEAAGFEIIGGLLDICIEAANNIALNDGKKYFRSKKILELIPAHFIGKNKIPEQDLYNRIMKICEFIAGMTDSYAIHFYKKLKGIELSKI
jgi:dGTPase